MYLFREYFRKLEVRKERRRVLSLPARTPFFFFLALLLCSVTFFGSPTYAASDDFVTFELSDRYFSTSDKDFLDVMMPVTVSILAKDGTVVWQNKDSIEFSKGYFSYTIGGGNSLTVTDLNISSPYIKLEVEGESTVTFAITAAPYAIHSKVAESVLNMDAANISGDITSTVNAGAGFLAHSSEGNTTFLYADKNRVGVGTNKPSYSLDIEGTLNASQLRINGVSYNLTTDWQDGTVEDSIYYSNGPVAIFNKNRNSLSQAFPSGAGFNLHVLGTMNVTTLLVDGSRITAALDWVSSGNNLYLNSDARVAIGGQETTALLNVYGAVQIDAVDSEQALAGVLAYEGPDFVGYIEDAVPVKLNGLDGSGQANRVGFWEGQNLVNRPNDINSQSGFYWDPNTVQFGINSLAPGTHFDILSESTSDTTPLVQLKDSDENIVFYVVPTPDAPTYNGSVSIGTSNAHIGSILNVNGAINVDDIFFNGQTLNERYTLNSIFTRNTDRSIFYDAGDITIGRSNIGNNAIQNKLEISSETGPATVLFTEEDTDTSFIIGILPTHTDRFMVNSGSALSNTNTLFSINSTHFGISSSTPSANLHVSGNVGFLVDGRYEQFSTANTVASGRGTRFFFQGSKAALRAGHLDGGGFYSGAEWDTDHIGEFSVAMGVNNLASGNHSTVFGSNNFVGGGYSTVSGGLFNKANENFSMALGRQSTSKHVGAFVWSDLDSTEFKSTEEDQFIINANNGLGINTNTTYLTRGNSVFPASLTIKGQKLTTDNIANISDSISYDDAEDIMQVLRAQGYFASTGYVSSNVDLSTAIDFSSLNTALQAVEPNVRQLLNRTATLSLLQFVEQTDNATGQAEGLDSWTMSNSGTVFFGSAPERGSTAKVAFMQGPVGINTEEPVAQFQIDSLVSTSDIFFIETSHDVIGILINTTGNVGMAGKFPADGLVKTFPVPPLRVPTLTAASFSFADGTELKVTSETVYFRSVSSLQGVPVNAYSAIPDIDNTESQDIWDKLVSENVLDENGIRLVTVLSSQIDDVLGDYLDGAYPGLYEDIWAITESYPLISSIPTGNIYFVSGNVGIGTSKPNQLLELSDAGSNGAESPVIAFDIDNTDRYFMGVFNDDPDAFSIRSGSDISDIADGIFTVVGDAVGIGTRTPTAPLEVVGTMINNGQFITYPPSANNSYAWSLPSINATKVSVSDNYLVTWTKQGNNIYFDTAVNPAAGIYANVGIGTSTPIATLNVAGTLNITTDEDLGFSLIISDRFTAQKGLSMDYLQLDTVSVQDNQLFVNDGELYFQDEDNSLSDIVTRGSAGAGDGGYLVLISDTQENDLIRSNIFYTPTWYDSDTGTFTPGTVSFNNTLINLTYSSTSENYQATNTLTIGEPTLSKMVQSTGTLTHNGSNAFAKSYTQELIDLTISTLNPAAESNFDVIGYDVTLSTAEDEYITNAGYAFGVYVDVSNIAVQDISNKGYVYSAIFESNSTGSVGIGTATPKATLDVAGTVSANIFRISDRLSLATLNMQSGFFYVGEDKKVGIGTESPKADLHVASSINNGEVINGEVLTTGLKSKGISAKTFTVDNANFIVTDQGLVGMGITEPEAQWHLNKVFSGPSPSKLKFLTVSTNYNGSLAPASITGIDITLLSSSNAYLIENANQLGGRDGTGRTGYGVKVDLSALNMEESNTSSAFTGVQVIGSSNATSKRNLAIFLGSNVGIGTTQPTATVALDIAGDIYATNFPDIALSTEQESGIYTSLLVPTTTQNGTIGGTVYAATVNVNRLYQNSISIDNAVDLSQIALTIPGTLESNHVIANTLTANSVLSRRYLSAQTLAVDTLGIGVTNTSYAAEVSTTTNMDTLTVTSNITAPYLSINSGDFHVQSSRVGIGTTTPDKSLSVMTTPSETYTSSNVFSWNGLYVNNPTATANYATGLHLLPGSNNTKTGSGILAIRAQDNVPTGSHLAFTTTSTSGTLSEIFRITASGNVGIGTTDPTSNLHVVGTVYSDTLTFDTLQSVTMLQGISGLSIPATLNINTTFNPSILVSEGEFRMTTSDIVTPPNALISGLYIPDFDKKLYFTTTVEGDIVSGNLGVTNSVGQNVFPYFNANHTLSGMQVLEWSTSNATGGNVYGVFSISSPNFTQISTITSLNVNSDYTQQTIDFRIGDRRTNSSTELYGVNIYATGNALHSLDTVVGLRVSMDARIESDYVYDSQNFSSDVYAATFMVRAHETSGNVGIHTSPNSEFRPSSDFHIVQGIVGDPILKVGTLSQVDALTISYNTKIGINTTQPSSQFHLTGAIADSGILLIENSAGVSLLYAQESGALGVGTTTPQAPLDVDGTVSSNSGIFGTAFSDSFTLVDNIDFVVQSDGLVGIGTSTPEAQLDYTKQFDKGTDFKQDYSAQSIHQSFAGSTTFTSSHTALSYAASTIEDNHLFNGYHARGATIDLSGVESNPGHIVTGLNIRVGTQNTTLTSPSRNAAIFMGRVGLGITEPTLELDLSDGILQANSFDVQDLAISDAIEGTINRRLIATDPSSITRLVFTSSNLTLRIVNDLTVSNPNSLDVTAEDLGDLFKTQKVYSDLATFNILAIGNVATADGLTRAFTVSGDASFTSLVLNDPLSVSNLTGSDVLVVSGSRIVIGPELRVSDNYLLGNITQIKASALNPSGATNKGLVYVNSSDNGLYYYYGDGSLTIDNNLSEIIGGIPTQIPLYGDDTYITGSPDFTWTIEDLGDYSVATLSITSSNLRGIAKNMEHFVVSSNIGKDDIEEGDYALETIKLTFENRYLSTSESSFYGLKIEASGSPAIISTYNALVVSFNNVYAVSSTDLPLREDSNIVGKKVAAIFLRGDDSTGNVGIKASTSNVLFHPEAELHISGNVNAFPPLWVVSQEEDTDVLHSALFVNSAGRVGIGITTPLTNRLTVKGLTSDDTAVAFSVVNSEDTPLIHVVNNGQIGFGTTEPKGTLSLQNSDSTIAPLLIDTTTDIITMKDSGALGIGRTNPVFTLDTFSNDYDTAALDATNYQVGNVFQSLSVDYNDLFEAYLGCNAGKFVFVKYTPDPVPTTINDATKRLYEIACQDSTSSRLATNTFQYGKPAFVIERNESDYLGPDFIIEPNGVVGIGRSIYHSSYAPSFNTYIITVSSNVKNNHKMVDLFVSGNVLTGDLSMTDFPDYFQDDSITKNYMFLVSSSNYIAGFGTVSDNTIVHLGPGRGDRLLFETDNGEAMRLQGAGLGIGSTEIAASLNIVSDKPFPLIIETLARKNVLTITDDGYVGVLTTAPSTNMHVDGSVRVYSVIDAPNGGTLVSANTVIVSNNVGTHFSVNSTISRNLGQGFSTAAESIDINIKSNIGSDTITGLSIQGISNAGIDPTGYITGVRVDVEKIVTFDASAQGGTTPVYGNKYAAVFNGGIMQISSFNPTLGYTDHMLQVIDSSNDSLAGFTSIDEDNNTTLNFVVQSRGNFSYDAVMLPSDFLELDFITSFNESLMMWQALVDEGHLVSLGGLGGGYVPVAGNTPVRSGAAASWENNSNFNGAGTIFSKIAAASGQTVTTVIQSAYDIFAQHLSADVYSLDTTFIKGGTSVGGSVYIISGATHDRSVTSSAKILIGAASNISTAALQRVDSELTVSGDVQLGAITSTPIQNAGYGSKLFFSGAEPLHSSYLGIRENSDRFILSRYNYSSEKSELRLLVGEENSTDSHAFFTVGHTGKNESWADFTDVLTAGVFMHTDDISLAQTEFGGVGIGTTIPSTNLHIIGSTNSNTSAGGVYATSNYLMTVDINESSALNQYTQGIGIKHSGTNIAAPPTTEDNFVSFFVSTNNAQVAKRIGAIEGNGSNGVQFNSTGGDYAEYLPKLDKNESLSKGDVVGVYQGKITKKTQGADQIMVLSTAPIIVGNWSEDSESTMGLVAFLGQVKTKVNGPVRKGDYLIPSGLNDGSAVAVNAYTIKPDQLDHILGQAWESSEDTKSTLIHTVVGFPFKSWVLSEQLQNTKALHQSLRLIGDNTQNIKNTYAKRLEEQRTLIDQLKAQLHD